jgi:hypothetical protein
MRRGKKFSSAAYVAFKCAPHSGTNSTEIFTFQKPLNSFSVSKESKTHVD